MPGNLLHSGASVNCAHGAPAQTVTANTKVLVAGAPVLTVTDTTTVAGCPFQVPVGPGTKPQPCVRVTWLTPATRVLVNGQPALLHTSTGLCQSVEQIPQGAPTVVTVQPRVSAQ
ncbi:PAAR-like protein [Streptomyces sp. NPDC001657]|uniref:PAAR-like protein n=1 Tax=Streptomyces sp. NPDC001657 TaxID=3154522 RepID=UPI003317329A